MGRRRKLDPSRQRIARNVAVLRAARGYTQYELGQLAGSHRTFIGAVERAEVNISIDNVDRIALALSVDPVVLLAPQER
jgi:transcriptional regulator with XRE-family HTH domain